jgi:hypothetical protein
LLQRTAAASTPLSLHWLVRSAMLMSHELSRLPTASLMEGLADLEDLAASWRAVLRPASLEEIVSDLAVIAELMQAPVPQGEGMKLYLAALSTMPRPVWKEARKQVVMRHKWPRLPLPADFIEAGQAEAEALAAITNLIGRAVDKFTRALATAALQ